MKYLETFKMTPEITRDLLLEVARTSLNTKIHPSIANPLTEIVVDAVNTITRDDNIDLHMIEIMHMQHKMSTESKLVRGLVLDHGGRQSDMPSRFENCYIMCLNVSLEYEKTEVNSGFFWSSPEQRQKLIESERQFTDDRVHKIVELKKRLCDGTDKNFIVIN